MAVRGFTLLEMLVVLVILGMAAGLVAPSLSRTADRVREAGDRDDVRRLLHALPILVRAQGVPLHLGPGEPLPIAPRSWPEGWSVVALTELRVESSGWCLGGQVRARGPSSVQDFTLESPDCAVAEDNAL